MMVSTIGVLAHAIWIPSSAAAQDRTPTSLQLPAASEPDEGEDIIVQATRSERRVLWIGAESKTPAAFHQAIESASKL